MCTFANGTLGVKCDGRYACSGHYDLDEVGCGSCNKEEGCLYAAGPIGEDSCNGYRACYKSLGHVGSQEVADGSCNGYQSCVDAGSVHNNACNGDFNCYNADGSQSYNGMNGYPGADWTIGSNSCNGMLQSCYLNRHTVGTNSWYVS
jgi:hypothetical protein